MRDRDKRYKAQFRFAEHYLGLLRAADGRYQRGTEGVPAGLSRYDEERLNIKQGQRWAAAQAKTNLVGALLCIEYADAAIDLLNLREHPHERIAWLESAIASARMTNIREAEGVSLANLGMAYKDLSQISRALDLYQQALVILRETGPRRVEANALGHMGTAYRELGQVSRAVELYQQQLVISRELQNRRDEGKALNNLGNAYNRLG